LYVVEAGKEWCGTEDREGSTEEKLEKEKARRVNVREIRICHGLGPLGKEKRKVAAGTEAIEKRKRCLTLFTGGKKKNPAEGTKLEKLPRRGGENVYNQSRGKSSLQGKEAAENGKVAKYWKMVVESSGRTTETIAAPFCFRKKNLSLEHGGGLS